MNSCRTSQCIVRLFLCGTAGFAAFTMTTVFVLGQQPARVKSNGTAATRVDSASMLREAVALLQAGKLDEAEPLVRRAVGAAPRDADAHNLLGVILDQRGRAGEAEREYREALRLNPKRAITHASKARVLAALHRYDEAISVYAAALGKNGPKSSTPIFVS